MRAQQKRAEKLRRAKVASQVLACASARHLTIQEALAAIKAGMPAHIIRFRGADMDAWVDPKSPVGRELEPRPALKVFYRMWQNKRLRVRQLVALNMFIDDSLAAQGSSRGLVAAMEERVDTSQALKEPEAYLGAGQNRAADRVARVYYGLNLKERRLLHETIINPDRVETNEAGRAVMRQGERVSLQGIGAAHSGFKDKTARSASGTAVLQYLLDRVAEMYGL